MSALLLRALAGAGFVAGLVILAWLLPPLLRADPPAHPLAVGAVLAYAGGPMILGLLLIHFARRRQRSLEDDSP